MTEINTLTNLLDNLEIPELIATKMERLKSSEYFQFFDDAGYKALWNIIAYGIINGWTEDELDRFLFNPIKPTPEQIAIFRLRHQEIYKEQSVGLANTVDESIEQFFAISSSMYAGKSTLAAEVCRELEAKDYRVITMVPHFMGDFVTIRGREAIEGDNVGLDGFARVDAIPYNHDNYQELVESFGITKTEKVVIHFDEFSFLSSECILEFIQFLTINYSNVKVLLVGLDKNALGQELDAYRDIKQIVADEFVCKSFVPNAIDMTADLIEPTGTFTSRYVVLPDGQMVLDCGFLPIIVPKEFAALVYYTPANAHQHMYTILQAMGQFDLLESIVHPHQMQLIIRNNLFDNLKIASTVDKEA